MNIIKGNIYAGMFLVIGIALLNQGFATSNDISIYIGAGATAIGLIVCFIANRSIIAVLVGPGQKKRKAVKKRQNNVKMKKNNPDNKTQSMNLIQKWRNLRPAQKIALKSAVLTMILGMTSNIPHELGHGLVCWDDGHNFEWTIGPMGGAGACDGAPSDVTLFYFMGGGLAGIVFVTLGGVTKKLSLALSVACLSIGLSQFGVAFVETFAHDAYMTNSPSVNFGIQGIGMASWFAVVYFRVARPFKKARLEEERQNRAECRKNFDDRADEFQAEIELDEKERMKYDRLADDAKKNNDRTKGGAETI